MAAPTKAPREDKELKGTLRKSRENEENLQAEPVKEIPVAPKDLPKVGQETWYRVVSELSEMGVLSTLDLDMLNIYCFQVATMMEAKKELKKRNGKVEKMQGKGGVTYYVKSPWVGIYNDAAAQVAKLAKEFGLSPLARKGIPAPKKKKEGRLVALMGGKK